MLEVLISGPIARGAIAGLCERVRVALKASDVNMVVCDVGTLTEPDAGTVDALARLQLTARRLGCRVLLRHACCELQDLLALMGLGEVLPLVAASRVDSRGQAEEWEQARGIEEEADPADPIT